MYSRNPFYLALQEVKRQLQSHDVFALPDWTAQTNQSGIVTVVHGKLSLQMVHDRNRISITVLGPSQTTVAGIGRAMNVPRAFLREDGSLSQHEHYIRYRQGEPVDQFSTRVSKLFFGCGLARLRGEQGALEPCHSCVNQLSCLGEAR